MPIPSRAVVKFKAGKDMKARVMKLAQYPENVKGWTSRKAVPIK
jgi:hypothetical protein